MNKEREMKKGAKMNWKPGALLFGAAFMFFLGGGDRPLELAIWVAPLLLLRFFMIQKPGKAYWLAYPVITGALFLAVRGMTPLPLPIFAASMAISGLVLLLPYLLHRVLFQRLPFVLHTLLFPVLMVTLDYLSSMGGWGSWGHVVYGSGNLMVLQLTSVTGIWGVGFLIAWTAAVGNSLWARDGNRINNGLMITWGSVMLVILLFGFFRLKMTAARQSISVAGVMLEQEQQKAFESALLPLVADSTVTREAAAQVRTLSLTLADSLIAKTDRIAKLDVELILMNEAAVPVFQSDADSLVDRFRAIARTRRVTLGATMAVVNDDLSMGMKQAIQNRLLLISSTGEVMWQYAKSVLVPGPETYMSQPGDSTIQVAELTPGRISGAICYEMDFPAYIRQTSQLKSELFLVPANDWVHIKRTHAKMARVRAIENGTALFRVVSRGLSQAVDPMGRVLAEWDYFEDEGVFKTDLAIGNVRTVYGIIGDGFALLCVILALFLSGWSVVNNISARRKSA